MDTVCFFLPLKIGQKSDSIWTGFLFPHVQNGQHVPYNQAVI